MRPFGYSIRLNTYLRMTLLFRYTLIATVIFVATPTYSQQLKRPDWSLIIGYSASNLFQTDKFKDSLGPLGISNDTDNSVETRSGWRIGFLLNSPLNKSLRLGTGFFFDQIEIQSSLYHQISTQKPPDLLLEERWENNNNRLWYTRLPLILEKDMGGSKVNFRLEGGLSLDLMLSNKEKGSNLNNTYFTYQQGYNPACECLELLNLEALDPPNTYRYSFNSFNYSHVNMGILMGGSLFLNLNDRNRLKIGYQLHQDVLPSQELWYRQENEIRKKDYRHLSHTFSLAYELIAKESKDIHPGKSASLKSRWFIGPGINYYFTRSDTQVKTSGIAPSLDMAFYLPARMGFYLRYSRLIVFTRYKDRGFSADLGISYYPDNFPVYIRSGLSFINTSNSDGGYVESKGYHLAGGTFIPINKWLVLRADISPKFWFDKDVGYSIETGLGLFINILKK